MSERPMPRSSHREVKGQQSDGDGEDAIAERLEATRAHRPLTRGCSLEVRPRVA
jgi:hypothetical protein